MATVFDVAEYVLRRGPMTAMKLQRLAYYCQAWSLVWDERPLFHSRIEAWANGPVVPDLYARHAGRFSVSDGSIGEARPEQLEDEEVETIDAVLGYYGGRTSQWLNELSHREDPWCCARSGLRAGQPCSETITEEAMANYYSSLL